LYVAHKFRAALAGKRGADGRNWGPGKLIFILWQTGQHGKWGMQENREKCLPSDGLLITKVECSHYTSD